VSPDPLAAAHALAESGRLKEAQERLTRLLARPGVNPDAAMLMSVVCTRLGEPAKGAYWAERVLAAMPEQAGAHANLVSALCAMQKFDQAIDAARRAQARLPDDPTVGSLLPMALNLGRRRIEGYKALVSALERFPDHERLYDQAVSVLLGVGRSDLALGVAETAAARWPDNPKFASDLIRALAYARDDSAGLASALASYQRALALGLGPPMSRWLVEPDPDRRLNIGVLSGDVCRHAVMFFARPLFDHADRARVRLLAYSTTASSREDDWTREIRERCAEFRRVAGLSPAQLCERIIEDRVDVLVELSGHTPGEALGAVHLRPAPVIVHWVAFPGSLGLRAVGWRVSDDALDPPGGPRVGPDRPLRISPCYVPFVPAADAPDPAPGPLQRGEGVVFGSISSMMKVTDAGLRLWAGAVNAVPGSRMYFKSAWLDDQGLRAEILERFRAAGMPMDRLTLDGPSPSGAATLACYRNFDITLDTYPYHGMTTTCESSWMGVPTVALAGGTVASRVNVSLLGAMGLGDLVAQSPEQFVRTAAALAADAPRLRAWRSPGPGGLRSMMAASALRDEAGFVRRLEDALRGCWREWCASVAPAKGASA
jgi:predicted O-linked N-acetylglucosamine transferase (SPINDLY family)